MRCRSAWVGLLGAILLATGCSGTKADTPVSPPSPSPDTSAVSSPSATPAVDAQLAVDAYQAMWAAMAEASQTSDWKAPGLSLHASGYALDQIIESLQADQQLGLVSRGRPVTNPSIVSVDPPGEPIVVRLLDCGDDSGWIKVDAKGRPASGGPGGRHRIDAEVRLEGGTWKVVDFRLRAVGTC